MYFSFFFFFLFPFMLTTNRRTEESRILNALQPTHRVYINKFDAENDATCPSRKERRNRKLHSCPYLAVTRDSSLLNATSDEKWKGKDRRTTREERIRGDMRATIERDFIYIGCIHTWKRSGRACIVWENTDDKNGVVVCFSARARARVCVCG